MSKRKSVFEKEWSDLAENEYFAYTFSKIDYYTYCRLLSHNIKNIYDDPPSFSWRFKNADKAVFNKIKLCVELFQGKTQWVYFKANRNHIIQPKVIKEIIAKYGAILKANILKEQYPHLPYEAVEDIIPLCHSIEKEFQLEDKPSIYKI